MKLTRASVYALHALVHLAREAQDRPIPAHEIARAQGVPELFLPKALDPLVSAGVLRSLKGPHGGYRLARPARDIELLEVVEVVGGPVRGEVPPFGGTDTAKVDRKLQAVCDQVAAAQRQVLGGVTVADLAAGAGKAKAKKTK